MTVLTATEYIVLMSVLNEHYEIICHNEVYA